MMREKKHAIITKKYQEELFNDFSIKVFDSPKEALSDASWEKIYLINDDYPLCPDFFNLFSSKFFQEQNIELIDFQHKEGVELFEQTQCYFFFTRLSLENFYLNKKESFQKVIFPFRRNYRAKSNYRPCLFLDRDGVLNVDTSYVHKSEDFVFVEGVCEFLKDSKFDCFRKIILTNQAGIAKGLFSIEEMNEFHEHLKESFLEEGICFDDLFYCPYHKDSMLKDFTRESFLRKPKEGMLIKALEKYDIDLGSSLMIGDKFSDCLDFPGPRYFILRGQYTKTETLAEEKFKLVSSFKEVLNQV